MAKTVNKKVSKPAAKAKKPAAKVSKPAAKPAQKSAAKTVSKKPAPKKPAPAPKAVAKPAPKPVAKPVQKAAPPKGKPAPAAKVPEPVKKTVAPVAPPVDKKPVAKQEKPAPLPPIDTSNLPKLPKGIVLKRQKGKLAPGEKRIVKTNVITHHIISDIELEADNKKQKPEPAGKFVMEYLLHTPVSLLYDFLTTPNGLAEWFADGVDMKNDIYTFEWDGVKQDAKIVSAKLDSHIRLRWLDKPEGFYFEFKVEQDELTNEVSLIVTDFGDGPDDIATSRHLWETQIHRLMKALGSY